MYRLWRPLLFTLDAERSHTVALALWNARSRIGLCGSASTPAAGTPVRLMGLEFANAVGLAAGFDKNGTAIDALGALGFGFLEIGTVTPRPQPGNPRPRVFRAVADGAVINRMGFPNEGVAALAVRLARRRYSGICGVNIGKNADTPLERAADDYVACLRAVHHCADYITVNVSSPNTAELRRLEQGAQLAPLLERLLEAREQLRQRSGRKVPLLVKLSPDLPAEALADTAATLARLRVDGVIATNSSNTRPPGLLTRAALETGGLSGAPLHALSIATIARLRALLGPGFPIIGVGGIHSVATARATLAAGADLVQLYTGLIYEGPGLARRLARAFVLT